MAVEARGVTPKTTRASRCCTVPAASDAPCGIGPAGSLPNASTELGGMMSSKLASAASYALARSTACSQLAAVTKRLSIKTRRAPHSRGPPGRGGPPRRCGLHAGGRLWCGSRAPGSGHHPALPPCRAFATDRTHCRPSAVPERRQTRGARRPPVRPQPRMRATAPQPCRWTRQSNVACTSMERTARGKPHSLALPMAP